MLCMQEARHNGFQDNTKYFRDVLKQSVPRSYKQHCRSEATIYITTSRMLHEKKGGYSWTPNKIYSFCEP